MRNEKQIILDKIDTLINKRKLELLNGLPSIHEIVDGIIIRFFTNWENCECNNNIKYKKINNEDNPNEIIYFMYLPKDTDFEIKRRDHISSIICLSGKIKLKINGIYQILENYSKLILNTDIFEAKVLENTYIVTTNNK